MKMSKMSSLFRHVSIHWSGLRRRWKAVVGSSIYFIPEDLPLLSSGKPILATSIFLSIFSEQSCHTHLPLT